MQKYIDISKLRVVGFYAMLTLLALCFGGMASAQEAAMNVAVDANMHIVFETAGEKEYRTVQYALFKTATKAAAVMQQLEVAVAQQRGDNGAIEIDAWDKAVARNKVKFRTSKGNGDFRVHAYPDMAVLVCSYLPDDELTIEDARFAIITVKPGQDEYLHSFQVKMDKGSHTISNVDVLGTNRDTISITTAPAIDDGKNMFFKVHIELPAGYGNERGRLAVQPMAVDCQTEDTVEYVRGLVMEGPQYHKVQNKRMLFNYMKYDKVAPAYISKPMYSDEKVYIDTTLVYVKQDRRKTYKIPYTVQIADFNHVYFNRTATAGSCNAKNIFKFLDLGVAAAQMDLEEFRIDAESNYDTKNQDLKLNFVVGKSELTNDSINQEQLNALIKELKSYGDQLMEVSVSATASPDGGIEANQRLAAQRTRVAANKVRSYLGKVDVAFHIAEPKVYTWDDVAKEKALDTLATEDEILQRMRTMRVTYRYEREHVMDEGEVRQAYYQRKHSLLNGTGKDFSDGDYFNLYNAISDPAEQDTITMLAYKHITKRGGYEQVKFSMYVANRMAMLNQRMGKPDSRVLDPFINKRLRAVSTMERGEKAQKNRREVLINQIITYFQQEERDSALSFCNYWFANDTDPKVERLREYIKFKEGFIKYATHQLNPAEEQEVQKAMDYVISCALDNKAVIYTEARDLLNVPDKINQELVAQMDDMNPKKWYLKGILEADKEEQKPEQKLGKDYIPDYLCYFHRCFELEPSFKWTYFYDGQISDQLREKFKYRNKDKARYRQMFYELALPSSISKPGSEDDIEVSGDDDDFFISDDTPAEEATE